MKKTLCILLCLAATAASAITPSVPAPTPECGTSLTATTVSRDDLIAGNVDEAVSDLLEYERNVDPGEGIAQLRRVVEKLVTENAITQEQAETTFGDRVLGFYTPIILKYVVAELKARDFDDENIIDFILNFETAYSPETRVDFAVSVARRMLLTVGDAGQARRGGDLERYHEFVDSFGVDRALYAQFRDVWRHVREAHTMTVVHFILTNIKRTAATFEADVRETIAQPAALPTVESLASRFGRWLSMADTPPPPTPIELTLRQVALETFNGFEVPKFLHDIDALNPERPAPPPLLERFLNAREGAVAVELLERLEMSPPFAWDILVRAQLEYLNFREIARVSESPLFKRFPPALQDAVVAQRKIFEDLRAAAMALHEHQQDAEREYGKPNFQVTSRFEERLRKLVPSRQLESGEWVNIYREAFTSTLKLWSDMNSAEFIEICKLVVARTFEDGSGYRALAIVKILRESSKQFVFAPGKLEQLFDAMDVYPIQQDVFTPSAPVSKIPSFVEQLEVRKWGRAREPGEPDPSALARADLEKIRQLLPPAETAWKKDEDLAKIFSDHAKGLKEASFLNTKAVESAAFGRRSGTETSF